jgi:hypothetical protein
MDGCPTAAVCARLMTTHFFDAPDFLELLQFWDGARQGRPLPEWDDDVTAVPAALLPNLVISERPEAIYRYVGAECVRRWGSDPTGRRIYDEVLTGAHARYIRSLSEACLARRAPIFSAAVYQPDMASVIMTGRLHLPFTYRGSAEPRVLFTLQLFKGSEQKLQEIGLRCIVHEIRRDMIAMVPELCARMAEVRRFYQISRHTHQRALAQDVDTVTQELTGSALIPLPCLDDPDPAATPSRSLDAPPGRR